MHTNITHLSHGRLVFSFIYNLKEQTSLNQTLNINLLILKMAKHSPKNVCVMNNFKNLVRSCRQFCHFKFLPYAYAVNFFFFRNYSVICHFHANFFH